MQKEIGQKYLERRLLEKHWAYLQQFKFVEDPMELCNGDVLLFRPATWLGRLVAWATRSEYCHAAIYDHYFGVIEMREFHGWQNTWMEDFIESRSDEIIDVFRSEIPDGVDVVRAMVALYHEPYSFLHGITAFLLRRIPKWLRKLFRFECDHHGYHCSQAISKAYRDAGFDLRPDISDWATTPGDLAKSEKLRKIGRLVFS